jgi:hypothetical protein
VLLAAARDGCDDQVCDGLIPSDKPLHLGEARRIDVQRIHGKQELSREQSAEVVVEPVRRLWKSTRRVDDTVNSIRISRRKDHPRVHRDPGTSPTVGTPTPVGARYR